MEPQQFKQLVEQFVLQEAFSVNRTAVKVSGILKRQGNYRLGRFKFTPLNIDGVGKQAIHCDVFETQDKDIGAEGQLVFISKSTGTDGEIISVLFDGLPGTPESLHAVKAIRKAIETAKLDIDGDYKIKKYNVGSGEDKRTVFVYGTNQLSRTDVKKVIDKLYGRSQDEDVKKESVDCDDETLDEATSQMLVTTSNNSTPANIRLKGSGDSAVSKLVTVLNSLRSTLFLQQVQDNGTCAVFTFGKQNKPTIELLLQRRQNSGNLGPRSFGVNASGVTDGNGDLIKGPAVAVIRISDRSGVLAYSGANTRLKTIVRGDNQLSSTTIAGVELTVESVPAIQQWLKSIVTGSSAVQIANSWSEFVKNQTPTQQQ